LRTDLIRSGSISDFFRLFFKIQARRLCSLHAIARSTRFWDKIMLRRIPCVLMRGGTSKGLFFLATDLPSDAAERDRILLAAMGSPDSRQIDGVGGADPLTSKVAIVAPAPDPAIGDVTYLFAQVGVDRAVVDTTPNCGNMLAGVAPFAISQGLVVPTGDETLVRVFNINTQTVADVIVQTPGGHVAYEGDVQIDGVPGTAAPIKIDFRSAAGSKTGVLLPTGAVHEWIDSVPVSCVDMAMPMLLVPATAIGKTGYETPEALNADTAMLARLECLRLEASWRMGLGDARGRVVPKLALIAPPQHGQGVSSRYFMPHACHAAHAVTGAICIAVAAALEGSVVHAAASVPRGQQRVMRIEHPSGFLEVELEITGFGATAQLKRAAVLRTARILFDGHVLVPETRNSSAQPVAA
jgi:2-methylaconitate cis-trans-isomerase PrpF